ncbi:transcription initiation factor IIB-like [Artemia franciscana]|uniref:Transcription initiation factor IIB n=1 Tax=Artemia franciscana TaxID=6661 RepID=A0AA88H4J2_ARTSF|nr:hypothetical protein QYM36_020001 [Artemia franciscana]
MTLNAYPHQSPFNNYGWVLQQNASIDRHYERNIGYEHQPITQVVDYIRGDLDLSIGTYIEPSKSRKFKTSYSSQKFLNSKTRSYLRGENFIKETIQAKLNLSNTTADIARFYFNRYWSGGKSLRGKNVLTIATSCVYLACYKDKVPRTLKEISDVSGIQINHIIKWSRSISEVVGHESEVARPDLFIERFCDHLKLPVPTKKKAYKIASKAMEHSVSHNRTVVTIASAAIYMAARLLDEKSISKSAIRLVTGSSLTSISLCFKELWEKKSLLLKE